MILCLALACLPKNSWHSSRCSQAQWHGLNPSLRCGLSMEDTLHPLPRRSPGPPATLARNRVFSQVTCLPPLIRQMSKLQPGPSPAQHPVKASPPLPPQPSAVRSLLAAGARGDRCAEICIRRSRGCLCAAQGKGLARGRAQWLSLGHLRSSPGNFPPAMFLLALGK